MTAFWVFAAAAGVKARSEETTRTYMARPCAVVPNCTILTIGDMRSILRINATDSAYVPVSCHCVRSPVVNRSAAAFSLLAASEAAPFAAGGSYIECGDKACCCAIAAGMIARALVTRARFTACLRTRSITDLRLIKILWSSHPRRIAGLQPRPSDDNGEYSVRCIQLQ